MGARFSAEIVRQSQHKTVRIYLNAVAYARPLQSQRQNRKAPKEREKLEVSSSPEISWSLPCRSSYCVQCMPGRAAVKIDVKVRLGFPPYYSRLIHY